MAYKDPADQKAYARRHYESNKSVYVARARAHDVTRNAAVRRFIREYLATHPCIDCGEPDPIVLEFDHRDRTLKLFNIGNAITASYALQTVKAEVSKCDVRCANCHRRKTIKERSSEIGRPCFRVVNDAP